MAFDTQELKWHLLLFSVPDHPCGLPPSRAPPSFPMDTVPQKSFASATPVPITEGNHCPIRLTFPYWRSRLPARYSLLCPGAHCYPPPPCTGRAPPRHSPSAQPGQTDAFTGQPSKAVPPHPQCAPLLFHQTKIKDFCCLPFPL